MAGTENRVQQAGKLFPKAGLLLMESAISKVEYEKLLAEIKQRIRSAQTRAALAVNRELVLLYWQIGREIVERQSREGWGAKVIERLAADLGREFPEVEGFGARNLRNMRDLAREWPDGEIVQQLVAKLPWGHNNEGGTDSWRLLHDQWAPVLNAQIQQELNISTIDAAGAWTELRKGQTDSSMESNAASSTRRPPESNWTKRSGQGDALSKPGYS
jgi:predicted nuclease of restriction endonuclease-like (RecB) superfamily